jgi:3-phosphoshikimate 1-carboxyvinyltransferase
MADWRVSPSTFKGALKIPASKSQSIRALLFALLGDGKSVIRNLLPSPDVTAMIHACKNLGAFIECFEKHLEITGVAGKISSSEDVIQAGNSGLILRLVGAISGLSPQPIVLTGDYSVRHLRPVDPLLDALSQLGAQAYSLRNDGGAPISVRGPLYSGSATLHGEDSQPVSGMLIASAFAPGPVELYVMRPGEKLWVDLTLSWLSKFGILFTNQNYEHYTLQGNASLEGFSYTVPSDFSSLSYPLAAAVLTDSEITIKNLDFSDPQGDKQLISHLISMGAQIEIDEDDGSLTVRGGRELRGIEIDVNACIDALPLLAVIGCFAEGKTEIKGAAIARRKESDRISCIARELKKMGALFEEHADGLTLYRSCLKGAAVDSCEDHRIALSLTVAGFAAEGKTLIRNIQCVDKSFPFFYQTMQKLGAEIGQI